MNSEKEQLSTKQKGNLKDRRNTCNHISDKGLIFKIEKELYELSSKTKIYLIKMQRT